MKGFRKLVVIGVLFVTLLVIIGTSDAAKNKNKKKEVESKRVVEKESSKSEKTNNQEKTKNKYKRSTNSEAENKENPDAQTKKNRGKKAEKEKYFEESSSPKITKTYQKVKKYMVVEDGPAEKFGKSKKSSKSQNYKENTDPKEVNKKIKKAPTKKSLKQKNSIEDEVNEELNKLYGLDQIFEEENSPNSKKKYKLVEVVMEEDGDENQEGNETILEEVSEENLSGIQRTESEEVIEKFKTTETVKLAKLKKSSSKSDIEVDDENTEESENNLSTSSYYSSELDITEDSSSNADHYLETQEEYSGCRRIPDDPSRKGPKKLVLYVIEEEIDGEITKRVVEEEDGVTMCEVADIMKKNAYNLS